MTESAGQSGGVSNSGTMTTGGGDVVGGNKIVTTISTSTVTEIHNALQPVAAAIQAAPADKHAEAEATLAALTAEAAKGGGADDGTLAKLVKGLVKLVPSAVSAVVSAFGTPILGGLAGPVTKFVLEEMGESGS